MKKQIIKILICAAVLGSFTSCRDALDIVQDGELSNENVYKNTSDLEKVLDGDVYRTLSNLSEVNFASKFTDETGIGSKNSEFGVGIHQFYVDITTPDARDIWESNYRTINKVVRLLDGAKRITPQEGELAAYNSYLAEGRALRAYSYLQLLAHYSTDMADPNALGVMIIDYIPDFGVQIARSKNSDVYKVIEDDLNFAEGNIDQTVSKARLSTQFFVSKAMVYATKARFYLYTKNYQKAKEYAQKAISTSGLTLTTADVSKVTGSGYDKVKTIWHRNAIAATSTVSYSRMLNDVERGEIIFGFSRPVTSPGVTIANLWENIAGLYATNNSTSAGAQYDMGRNLYNILRATDGDIRKYSYIDISSLIEDDNYLTMSDYIQKDVLVIKKYPGKAKDMLRNDIKIFRVSEMYLILAEAAAQSNLVEAAGYVKAIRDARNFKGATSLPVYKDKKEALIDILKERRVDLAFEGHRYVDLKRLRNATGMSIDRNITDDVKKDLPVTIPIEDFRWALPIPREELQANKLIQQNPGYKATP